MGEPEAPDAAPVIVAGRWKILDLLGRGGMGSVHLATDEQSGAKVAVKLLATKHASQQDYVERFEREAKVMASLVHPNLVRLFDAGAHEGRPYLVMELLEGRPLDKLLDSGLPLGRAVPLMKQLCAALTAMHEQGLIHRDLKPGNLFVGDDGHLTLLDFGIARPTESSLTKTGVVFGSPSYMAPEQIVGEKHLDARADIYAAAVVLFELLTGQLPFEADDEHQLLLKHLRDAPPDLCAIVPEVPKALNLVIQRALSKRADDRFPSAAELWAAIDEAVPSGRPPARAASGSIPSVHAPPRTTSGSLPAPRPLRRASAENIPSVQGPPRTTSGADRPRVGRTSKPLPALAASPDDTDPATLATDEPLPTQARLIQPVSDGPARPPLHLGQRILGAGALLLFVGFGVYLILGVLAELPQDESAKAPVRVVGTVTPPPPPPPPPLQLAEKLRPIQAEAPGSREGITGSSRVNSSEGMERDRSEEAGSTRASRAEGTGVARGAALPRADPGQLRVTATLRGMPVAAAVLLDGKARGRTPVFLPIGKSGVYELQVAHAGAKPVKLELVVDTYKGQNMEVELDERWLSSVLGASDPYRSPSAARDIPRAEND